MSENSHHHQGEVTINASTTLAAITTRTSRLSVRIVLVSPAAQM